MTASGVFEFCNAFALISWILMIFAPKWKWTPRIVLGIVAIILSLFYAFYILQSLSFEDFQSFSSLEGLMTLFGAPEAVLAGWIHYLAFDMIVGYFILTDAQKNKINHYLVIPCLLFSFMMGPVGFLIYTLIRLAWTKKYFINNDLVG